MRCWLLLVVLCGCDASDETNACGPELPLEMQQLSPTILECRDLTRCNRDEPSPVTWGLCFGPCQDLEQAACEADDRCRAIHSIECEIRGDCPSTFKWCAPVDQVVDLDVDCDRTSDAQRCSQSPHCSAWHTKELEGEGDEEGSPVLVFRACSFEGTPPGRCNALVTCDEAPPACPEWGQRPLVKDGCYTGGCIAWYDCEPAVDTPAPTAGRRQFSEVAQP